MSTPPGPSDPYGGGQGGYGQAPPPGYYGGGSATPPSAPPPNYLVWAILSTVLCCLPLGIASIVFSTQVNTKWAQGDQAGAHESARKAKQFAIWSAIAGLVVAVLYGVLLATGVMSMNTYGTTTGL